MSLNVPGIGNNSVTASQEELAILAQVDSVIIADDSSSMAPGYFNSEEDPGRQNEMIAAVEGIAPVLTKHDKNGIDLFFLNDLQRNQKNLTTGAEVTAAFDGLTSTGSTYIGDTLSSIMEPYWKRFVADPRGTRPINIIFITDGAASDKEKLKEEIYKSLLNIARYECPTHQFSMFFFQVGNPEVLRGKLGYELYSHAADSAKKFLVDLDDNLRNGFLDWLGKQASLSQTMAPAPGHMIKDLINTINSIPKKDGLGMYDRIDTIKLADMPGGRLTADVIKKIVVGALSKTMDAKDFTGQI